jgi:pyruvate,orthophosphate dikinase
LNDHSGTGVVVSRNPSTGQNEAWGEYYKNALGQDIADGSRTPESLQQLHDENKEVYEAVVHFASVLERHFKKVQTVEFTVQSGKLFLVNAYTTPLTATAAVRVAVAMVNSKQLTEREALLRIDPHQMTYFLRPMIDPSFGELTTNRSGFVC